MRRTSRWWWSFPLLLALLPGPARAQGDELTVEPIPKRAPKNKAKTKKRSIGFIVRASESADPATVARVDELAGTVSAVLEAAELVVGDKLRKRLRGDPQKQTTGCNTLPRCYGKLAKKGFFSELLVGEATSDGGGGTKITFTAYDPRGEELRTVPVSFATPEAAALVFPDQIFEVLALTDNGAIEVTGPAADVEIDGLVVGTGPGRYEAPPGLRHVRAGDHDKTMMVVPQLTRLIEVPADWAGAPAAEVAFEIGATAELSFDATGAEAPPAEVPVAEAAPPIEALALAAPPVSADAPLPSPAPALVEAPRPVESLGRLETVPRERWFLYGGVGAGALGVTSLVLGRVWASQAQSEADSIERGPQGSTQAEARRAVERHNTLSSRANAATAVGGIALLAGAVACYVDVFVLGPTTRVRVQPAAPGADVGVSLGTLW